MLKNDPSWNSFHLADKNSQFCLYSVCSRSDSIINSSMGQLARYFTAQLLSAIDHLQQNGVLHNDIKCANVLVMPDTTIRLSDFGCSKKLDGADDPQHDLKRLGSTVWLMAVRCLARCDSCPSTDCLNTSDWSNGLLHHFTILQPRSTHASEHARFRHE